MTLPRPTRRTLVGLSAGLVVCFGLEAGPLPAVSQPSAQPAPPAPQPTQERLVDPDEILDALDQSLSQMDIAAIVDDALRAASLALDAADIGRLVEQALEDARIAETVARQSYHVDVDADRLRAHVHGALADVDIHREVQRALEDVRHELGHEIWHEDIHELIHEALRDIEAIVREATEHAREAAREHRFPPM